MKQGKFELEVTGRTTAYLKLPTHPGVLRGARNVTLVDLLGAYKDHTWSLTSIKKASL